MTRREFGSASAAGIAAIGVGLQATGRAAHREDDAPVGDGRAADDFDVVIAGGGPAGLSAALVLGRSRRRVLVCDAGSPRNAPSPHAHSFFSRDGIAPQELLRIGREQLGPYDGVKVRDVAVSDAARIDGRFEVILADGARARAPYLILATGLVDELPEIPGVKELWGASVLHCPYCHGWEVRDRPLAVYRRGPEAFNYTRMVRGWSEDLVLCSDGPAELTGEERAWLKGHGIAVREEKIASLLAEGGRLTAIAFEGGELLPREALFLGATTRQRSPLPAALGCRFVEEEGPHRGTVEVDEWGFTGVEGLFVVGDASRGVTQLISAAADGAHAAFRINNTMLLG